MTSHSPLDHQLMQYLSQHSHHVDRRHLITLSWIITGVLLSQSLHLTEWEPFVVSRATQAQQRGWTSGGNLGVPHAHSYQKRWSRFLQNQRIKVEQIYIPLVMAAISNWSNKRLYLALGTTMLSNQYCMIHLSIICNGRAIPFLWSVEEHNSATIGFEAYRPLLRKASWLLRKHQDVMLLVDRGFANQDPRELKRAIAVKMTLQGYRHQEISTVLQVSSGFISKWKQEFILNGIEGLKLKYKGSKGYLSQLEKQQVLKWLEGACQICRYK